MFIFRMCAKSLQSCPALCDPMHCSPPGSFVHGVLQARMLEWVPCLPPGDLPNPGIKPMSPALKADSLPPGATWGVLSFVYSCIISWYPCFLLWPPDVESNYWKRFWHWERLRREEKRATEDEIVRWNHQLNEHEFEQTLGDSEGQRSLACYSPWGCKVSDMTERLKNSNNNSASDNHRNVEVENNTILAYESVSYPNCIYKMENEFLVRS